MQRERSSVVIVTGASSGVGLYAARALVDRGWYVVMACRDLAKANVAASGLGISSDKVSLELIDLGSHASVRASAARFTALPGMRRRYRIV